MAWLKVLRRKRAGALSFDFPNRFTRRWSVRRAWRGLASINWWSQSSQPNFGMSSPPSQNRLSPRLTHLQREGRMTKGADSLRQPEGFAEYVGFHPTGLLPGSYKSSGTAA